MTEVGDVYLLVFWWTLGFLAVSWAVLAGALVVLRLRCANEGRGGQGHSVFDLAWAVAPALIVMLVAVPAVAGALTNGSSAEESVLDVTAASVAVVEQTTVSGEVGEAISDPESQSAVACCESGRLRTTTEEDDLVN